MSVWDIIGICALVWIGVGMVAAIIMGKKGCQWWGHEPDITHPRRRCLRCGIDWPVP